MIGNALSAENLFICRCQIGYSPVDILVRMHQKQCCHKPYRQQYPVKTMVYLLIPVQYRKKAIKQYDDDKLCQDCCRGYGQYQQDKPAKHCFVFSMIKKQVYQSSQDDKKIDNRC